MNSFRSIRYFVPDHGSRTTTLPASLTPSTTTQCAVFCPRSKSVAAHCAGTKSRCQGCLARPEAERFDRIAAIWCSSASGRSGAMPFGYCALRYCRNMTCIDYGHIRRNALRLLRPTRRSPRHGFIEMVANRLEPAIVFPRDRLERIGTVETK